MGVKLDGATGTLPANQPHESHAQGSGELGSATTEVHPEETPRGLRAADTVERTERSELSRSTLRRHGADELLKTVAGKSTEGQRAAVGRFMSEVLAATGGQTSVANPYHRVTRPNNDASPKVPAWSLQPPPEGFAVVRSDNPATIGHFLESFPVSPDEALLEFGPAVQRFLNEKMPTSEAIDSMMKKIRRSLLLAVLTGDRVSKDTLGNRFSNAEMMGLVAGWERGIDIRRYNYAKTLTSEGRLDLTTLASQDCMDVCLRLWVEFLLLGEDYAALDELGVGLSPSCSSAETDEQIEEFFRTTSTKIFVGQHHDVGHLLTDADLSERPPTLECGDIIIFNKPGGLGGHSCIVMARAENEATGAWAYRLANGTLPATDAALYPGWHEPADFLGGGDLSNFISGTPLAKPLGWLFERGIKSDDSTVSIARLRHAAT